MPVHCGVQTQGWKPINPAGGLGGAFWRRLGIGGSLILLSRRADWSRQPLHVPIGQCPRLHGQTPNRALRNFHQLGQTTWDYVTDCSSLLGSVFCRESISFYPISELTVGKATLAANCKCYGQEHPVGIRRGCGSSIEGGAAQHTAAMSLSKQGLPLTVRPLQLTCQTYFDMRWSPSPRWSRLVVGHCYW